MKRIGLFTLFVVGMAIGLTAASAQTIDPPPTLNVLSLSPEPDSGLIASNETRITVMFDRSVIALAGLISAAPPLTITPALDGSGAWVHPAVYQFTPAENALQGGTTYTVTLDPAVEAVDGARLATPVAWRFTVTPPQVVEITPTKMLGNQVLRESAFTVRFSQPMDRASTEAAFSLRQNPGYSCFDACNSDDRWKAAGTFAWDADNTGFGFTPAVLLDYPYFDEGNYSVIITTQALTASGMVALLTPVYYPIVTVPRPSVYNTTPVHNGTIAPGLQRVIIDFAGVPDPESYRGRYTITPTPPGTVTPYVEEDGTLALEFEHRLNERYTITLLAGIRDVYGSEMVEPYTFSYDVRAAVPETGFSMNYRRRFVIAGPHLDEPSVPMSGSGEADITLTVYRADREMILDAVIETQTISSHRIVNDVFQTMFLGGSEYLPSGDYRPVFPMLPWRNPEYLVSSVTHAVRTPSERAENVYLPLTDPGSDSLPLGLYGVDAGGTNGLIVAVANAGITVQRGGDETFVLVTDIETGQPLPDIVVRADGPHFVSQARTDASGIARLNTPRQGFLLFTVQSETHFGAWYSEHPGGTWGTGPSALVYADRTLYRAGEIVHFRGIVRQGAGVRHIVPDGLTTIGAVMNSPCQQNYFHPEPCEDLPVLYQAALTISPFGTFSDSIRLASDLEPGEYIIDFATCPPDAADCPFRASTRLSFSVGEFRVPDFRVALTPQRDAILSGEPLNVVVESLFYSGSPLTDGEINYYGSGYSTAFRWRGAERGFRFGDSEFSGWEYTDHRYDLPVAADGRTLLTDAGTTQGSLPLDLTIEATVIDPAGQPISASTRVLIHPANVYIGLSPAVEWTDTLAPIPIDVISVHPDSAMRPNQPIRIEIVERRAVRVEETFGVYYWRIDEFPVLRTSLTTDAAGRAAYTFTPPRPGHYRVIALAEDEIGRGARSAVTVIVRPEFAQARPSGDALVAVGDCARLVPAYNVRITPDRELVQPGDIAELTIHNPYGVPVTAIVTIERRPARDVQAIQITGETFVLPVPVSADDAPNLIVDLIMVRPAGLDTPHPPFLYGQSRVRVDNVERRLNVLVEPSAASAMPGDTVSFDFHVTDHNGDPVSAEIGVALTDEAVLDMRFYRFINQESRFYPPHSTLLVRTTSASALLASPPVPEAGGCGNGGGGGGSPGPYVRDEFVYTPLWEPHLVTDADGRASVSVVMPDNLTEWRLSAAAITTDTLVGEVETLIRTALPLTVRAAAPRFFIAGDQATLSALVQNDTDAARTVTVRLDVTGFALDDATSAVQTIALAPRSLQRVTWSGMVEDVNGVSMTVYAEADNGLSDASIPTLTTGQDDTIPVYAFSARESVTFSGALEAAGSRVEAFGPFTVPAPQSAALALEFAPTLTDALISAAEAFLRPIDPEASVSDVASTLQISAALSGLANDPSGVDGAATAAAGWLIDTQQPEGGWSWYHQQQADPDTTARTVIALAAARDAGLTIAEDTLTRARDFLLNHVVSPALDQSPTSLDQQALILHALALIDNSAGPEPLADRLTALTEYRHALSLTGRSHLLLAWLDTAPDDPAVAALTADLTSAAIITGTGVHWQEANTRYPSPATNVRTTAIALHALLTAQPDHPLAVNAVRWLTRTPGNASADGRAWLYTALASWLAGDAETPSAFAFSARQGDRVWEGQFAPDQPDQTERARWTLDSPALTLDQPLTITRGDGPGALYYTGALTLDFPADAVGELARGVRIEREYVNDSGEPVRTPAVSDVVVVRLTLYVPDDLTYFTLEDTLPAGLEGIDPSMLVSTRYGEPPLLRSTNRDTPYWFWGAHVWSATRFYHTGVTLRARWLPRGVYTYTYQARAVTPGTFLIPPARGFSADQPDIQGRTAPGVMTVRE